MSRHHRDQDWQSFAPKRRRQLAAQLPLPCVECGQPVHASQRWEVGHRVAAALGGRPTVANTGPVHYGCNRLTGGKLGAAISNARRRQAKGFRAW